MSLQIGFARHLVHKKNGEVVGEVERAKNQVWIAWVGTKQMVRRLVCKPNGKAMLFKSRKGAISGVWRHAIGQ